MSDVPGIAGEAILMRLLLFSGLERLLIVAVAGLSIALGWSLFRERPAAEDGEAQVSALGWHVILRRIGPGVFFALFGAAVIVTALARPMFAETKWERSALGSTGTNPGSNQTPRASPQGSMLVQGDVSGFGSGRGEAIDELKLVHALNTSLALAGTDSSDVPVLTAYLADMRRAAPRLRDLRNLIVEQHFKRLAVPNAVELWGIYQKELKADPLAASHLPHSELSQIEQWMHDDMASETPSE